MTRVFIFALCISLCATQRPMADYSDTPFEPSVSDALVELEIAFGWPADRDHPRLDCTGLVHGIRCNPPAVGPYPILRTLVIGSGNGARATSVPTQIGRLTTLTDLTIKDLTYTTLPSEITRLTQLTRLALENVDLLAPIPRSLAQQESLTYCFIKAGDNPIGRQCTTCDVVPFCLVIAPVPACDYQCGGARLSQTDIVSLHNRDVLADREPGPTYSPPHMAVPTVATTTTTRFNAFTTKGEFVATDAPETTTPTIAAKTIPQVETTVATQELEQSTRRETEPRADYRFLYVGVAIAVVAVCVSVGVAVPVLRAYRATTSSREQHSAAPPPLQKTRTSEYDRVPAIVPNDNYNSSFQHVV